MSQVIINNPVINSPFKEPQRHFRLTDDGITDEIAPGRRLSDYRVPIAKPKFKTIQKALDFGSPQQRIENKLINDLRARVAHWRQAGRPYTTAMTRRLLDC